MKKGFFFVSVLLSFYALGSLGFAKGKKAPTSTPTIVDTFAPTPTSTAQLTPSSESFLVRPWTVGQTVSYEIESFVNDSPVSTETVSYSVIREETDNGNQYLWLELETDQTDGHVYLQDIKVRRPLGIDFENILNNDFNVLNSSRQISEIISSIPASLLPPPAPTPFPTPTPQCFEIQQPPQKINEVDNGPAPSETLDLSKFFAVTSGESITVNAGIFSVSEFVGASKDKNDQKPRHKGKKADSTTDAWGTPTIPIWGIVKRVTTNVTEDGTVFKTTMTLDSFGDNNAVPKIVATPIFITQDEEKILAKSLGVINP